MVMVDNKTSSLHALSSEKKGVVAWVLKWTVEKVNDIGYASVKITVRSDGEPAIVALMDALAVAPKAETAAIRSPVRGSRCNGKEERAVRTWRGQFVAIKDHVETMTKQEIPADSKILTWLVVHAAVSMNCYKV